MAKNFSLYVILFLGSISAAFGQVAFKIGVGEGST